jgi:hypothetical protein
MDFNHTIYRKLLTALQSQGFLFQTVTEYYETVSESTQTLIGRINPQSEIRNRVAGSDELSEANPQLILLRHDVEAKYGNALKMAKVQSELGIKGTYYFRIYPHKGNEGVIREIAALGHEIGYHLSACRGDYGKAIQRFQENLAYLRQFAPVTSATMEGAPLSRYDNRDLWTVRPSSPVPRPSSLVYRPSSPVPRPIYHYTDYGILTEPYFDLDFNKIFYLTDTGRHWDGHLYNVRDKATKDNPVTNPEFLQLRYHATRDIIHAVSDGSFPRQAMLNFHPQRWSDKPFPWLKELIWQNVKNQGKRVLLSTRK